MVRTDNLAKNIDWISILLYFLLVAFGWMNIYASVYNESITEIFDLSKVFGNQLLWIGISLFIAFIIFVIDAKFYEAFSYIIYIATILLLLSVLIFGREIAGSKSWLILGPIRIQPSEFAKFASCLALARFLSAIDVDFKDLKVKLIAIVIVFIPIVLIVLQGDAGSAIVYFSLVLVLFREGLSGKFLLLGVLLTILFILSLLVNSYLLMSILFAIGLIIYLLNRKVKSIIKIIVITLSISFGFIYSVDYVFNSVLEKHQRTRINVLLGKEIDLKGAGYNVHQAKIAIGSGGLQGKGFLQGTQTKFDFVPEQSTDFIFCTIGEEWGFIGTFLLISVFVFFICRIIFLAERQRSTFSRIYGYGVASILFFHFAVNIAMNIGFAPVIGIPLPFFSYGGSSLLAFTVLLFIFLKLDSYRMHLLA